MQMQALSTVTLALGLGVLSHALARRLRIPAIIFYLVAGLIGGPVGVGVIRVDSLGSGLYVLVEFAMAVVLFQGGLLLSTRGFLTAPRAIGRLIVVSLPLTAAGAALAAHWILGLSWSLAFLFGALTVVTGPTVIGPLLSNLNLGKRLESLLHWESIWGDVLGVLLVALALKLVALTTVYQTGEAVAVFALGIVVGTALGVLFGVVLDRYVLPWIDDLQEQGLPGIVAFAVAPAIFSISNLAAESSGPLAVAVAGFYLSIRKNNTLHSIRRFKDQLTVLFISTLFVLLSASIEPQTLYPMLLPMTACALVIGAVVRPGAMAAALVGSEVSWRERLYIGLIGPRGIISLASAAYASYSLDMEGDQMRVLLECIFLIVLLSGAWATFMGKTLARWLGVRVPRDKGGLVFVGLNSFTKGLASRAGAFVPVVFFDPRPNLCEVIRGQGLRTFCTEVLEEDIYEEAQHEGFHRLMAMSDNDALNRLAARKATALFGAKQVYRVEVDPRERVATSSDVDGTIAFDGSLHLHQAVEDLEQGRARIELVHDHRPGQGVALLQVTANGGVRVVLPGDKPAGSVIRYVRLEEKEKTEPAASEG